MRSFALLLACLGLAPAQNKVAPVPADSHELVTGVAEIVATPQDRASAMALLERARQNSDLHMPGGSPFSLKVAFNVTGNGAQTGPGQTTETWFSGRRWRYDQTLGAYSETRVSDDGRVFGKRTAVTPMSVQMVRSALFWPVVGNPSVSTIRTAAASWNGKPVTAILISGNTDSSYPGRHWVETEYVIDNSTGLLQIYSRAPGTFAVYGYQQGLQFHGRMMPDHIAIFVAGVQTVDAQVTSIQNPGAADSVTRDSDMQPDGPASLGMNMRFPLLAHDPTGSGMLKQVIVHASTDEQGNVVEAEVSAAADQALIEPAIALVKTSKFPRRMEAYINVRFTP